MTDLNDWAVFYYDLGFNVTHIVPSKNDHSKYIYKAPTNSRQLITHRRQEINEMQSYDWENATGIGMILGRNNIRALDVDHLSKLKKYSTQTLSNLKPIIDEFLVDAKLPVNYPWVVQTPSKGYHIIIKTQDLPFKTAISPLSPYGEKKTKAFKLNNKNMKANIIILLLGATSAIRFTDMPDDANAEIIAGGNYDKSKGYFIEPTVILTKDPKYTTMCTELFGPVATIYVYDDATWLDTLALVDATSEYALTGAVFSTDRYAITEATNLLENCAGNFYINDKPSGAVVGQQPFGGARASGTNDKAGSAQNLLRWVSPRLIKETLVPPSDYRYPFLS